MTRIALIGCTGSIGSQVLDVVRAHPEQFSVSALVCGRDARRLNMLAEEFSPRFSFCAQEGKVPLGEIFSDCDAAFIAAGGFAGLSYTLSAIRAGRKVLLANKESLVCGGELVMREAEREGVPVVPVDSEHSAIFQALSFRRDAPFKKLILTASGGPFLRLSPAEMEKVTAKDALRHPTWNMGAKITVDSATLLNKGYEVIEARWLYNADFSQIEAVVHPESIVHSLVAFEDGALLAQLGYPDMRVPIQLALTYPARLPCIPAPDLAALGKLTFERLPAEKFPCYSLALRAGMEGGTTPTVLNAAAEESVKAFLAERISFPQIAETIEDVLAKTVREEVVSYRQLAEVDLRARRTAKTILYDN